MKIWHQSFTDLEKFPAYRDTLESHAQRVGAGDFSVVVHGLRPGSYPDGIAPMEVNRRGGLRLLNIPQVCEAAVAAEKAGYDAFALGCFFDPGLQEVRSLVDIPVVSLTESCMLTACSLGKRFALVSLTEFQQMLTQDLAAQYGLQNRLAGVVAMTPGVQLFDLEQDGEPAESIKQRFRSAVHEALKLGAEVIIPGDGILNEFLVRHRMLSIDGAVILDALGLLFHHAVFFARARSAGCLDVSRRLLYAKPTKEMLDHAGSFHAAYLAQENMFSGRR